MRAVGHARQQAALVPPERVVQRGPPAVAHAPPEPPADERERSAREEVRLVRWWSELVPRGELGAVARALRRAAFEEHVATWSRAAAVRRHAREAIWASQAVVLDARMQQTERAELDGRKSQEWAQHASPVPLASVQQQEGWNVLARQTDDFPRLVPFLRRATPADDGWHLLAVRREPRAGIA